VVCWACQLMACFCNLLFFDSVFVYVCSWQDRLQGKDQVD